MASTSTADASYASQLLARGVEQLADVRSVCISTRARDDDDDDDDDDDLA